MVAWIWLAAAALYLVFLYWYINWSGPIAADEIDGYLDYFSAGSGAQYTDVEVLRRFLEEDDGKEFVMQNFISLHSGKMAHPVTGEAAYSQEVIGGYYQPFVKAL